MSKNTPLHQDKQTVIDTGAPHPLASHEMPSDTSATKPVRSGRRQFLITTAAMGGSLVCGVSFAATGRRATSAPAMSTQGKDITAAIALNAWLRIAADGTVWLAMPRSEMGQGIHMAIRMLVAEELGCPLASIELEDADIRTEFANQTVLAETVPFRPDDDSFIANSARAVMRRTARLLDMQITGGSTTLMDAWTGVRVVAAGTRMRLEAAAAAQWGVDAGGVSLVDGVIKGPSGQSMPMAAAISKAMDISTPSPVKFRDPAAWRIIGSQPARSDLRNKVDGSAVFGVDVRVPGRVVGVPRFCPVIGGTVQALRNRDALLARPGVIDVITLPLMATAGGILVVAKNFWTAQQAAQAADIEWFTPPQSAALDTSRISLKLRKALDTDSVHWTYYKRGDSHWSGAAETPAQIDSRYEVPYLAHATLEPMNATAWLRDGQLDVWAPTQAQGPARGRAAQAADVSASQVRVHTTYLGGAFGRRLETDFIAIAAYAAKQLPGRPVQVIWPREEDTAHDYYRPAATARLQARLDKTGRITHWHHRSASPSVAHQAFRRLGLPGFGPDKGVAEGAFDNAYTPEHVRIDHVLVDPGVPVGYWRSVGHSYQAFFAESFMDELAEAARMDPLSFRLKNLPADSREARALKAACDMAGYQADPRLQATADGNPTKAAATARRSDVGIGMAVHHSFGSVVALVMEVQRAADGKIRVSRVWCAADCGLPVHPDGIRQQLEGGIVFGLTAALKSRIDVDAGAVRQRNFSDYPLLSLAESPDIVARVLPSTNPPSGVGEISVPPVAPALANALFRLTGQRQRVLPLSI